MNDLDLYNEQQQTGIVTLQHRYRELGRLRAGEQRTSRNGQRYPAKLDTFRFTSTDWRLIQRAADIYGGKPSRWEDAPSWNKEKQTGRRQFQVTVEADRILVSVPAQQQLTQSMEYWTAGGCQRRCNGVAMSSGEPCECRAEMEAGSAQLCDHYTRANFILPNLPGLGVWRLESHGVFTASELPLQLAMAARYGPDVEWWLRLDPRDYRTTESDGKPVTYHFHVPVLDTDHTPAELYALQANYLASSMPPPAIQPSDPAPAPPRGLAGADPTSPEPAARGVGRIVGSGDPNASVTGPGDTDASSAGHESPNAEATTSPASPGDDRPGRGKREPGTGKPGNRTPVGPQRTSERGDASDATSSVKQAGSVDPGEGEADPSLLPEPPGWER
jgi:hypothetical protein